MRKTTENHIRFLLLNNYTKEEICQILRVQPEIIDEYLKRKEEEKNTPKEPNIVKIPDFNVEEICFISDIHYGSLYDRPDIMETIYEECEKRGVRYIFCAGDLTNGNYPIEEDYKNLNRISGAQNTIEYVANVHPYSKNIKMYTIAGNHDITFPRNQGIDVCKEISKVREDIVYLGHESAQVYLGRLNIVLNHGYYNTSANLESRLRRYYKRTKTEPKPDILALGHIHVPFYHHINDTHILQVASTMDLLPHHQVKGEAERSCWFVKVIYDNFGSIFDIIPEKLIIEDDLVLKRKR